LPELVIPPIVHGYSIALKEWAYNIIAALLTTQLLVSGRMAGRPGPVRLLEVPAAVPIKMDIDAYSLHDI